MRVLRLNEVVTTTGLSRTTIYRLMSEDRFPRSVRLGPNSVGWIDDNVTTWIKQRGHGPLAPPEKALRAAEKQRKRALDSRDDAKKSPGPGCHPAPGHVQNNGLERQDSTKTVLSRQACSEKPVRGSDPEFPGRRRKTCQT